MASISYKPVIEHNNGLKELVRAWESDSVNTTARLGDNWILYIRRKLNPDRSFGSPEVLTAYERGEEEFNLLDRELLEARL